MMTPYISQPSGRTRGERKKDLPENTETHSIQPSSLMTVKCGQKKSQVSPTTSAQVEIETTEIQAILCPTNQQSGMDTSASLDRKSAIVSALLCRSSNNALTLAVNSSFRKELCCSISSFSCCSSKDFVECKR